MPAAGPENQLESFAAPEGAPIEHSEAGSELEYTAGSVGDLSRGPAVVMGQGRSDALDSCSAESTSADASLPVLGIEAHHQDKAVRASDQTINHPALKEPATAELIVAAGTQVHGSADSDLIHVGHFDAGECVAEAEGQEDIASATTHEEAAKLTGLIAPAASSSEPASRFAWEPEEAGTCPEQQPQQGLAAYPPEADLDAASILQQHSPDTAAELQGEDTNYQLSQPGLVAAISDVLELSDELTFGFPEDTDSLEYEWSNAQCAFGTLATGGSLVLSEESAYSMPNMLELPDGIGDCFVGSAVSSPDTLIARTEFPGGRRDAAIGDSEHMSTGLLASTGVDVIAAELEVQGCLEGSDAQQWPAQVSSALESACEAAEGGAADSASFKTSALGASTDGAAEMRPTATTADYESASESSVEGLDLQGAMLGPMEAKTALKHTEDWGMSVSSLAAFAVMRPTATTAEYESASESGLEGWESVDPDGARTTQLGMPDAHKLDDQPEDSCYSTASEDEVSLSSLMWDCLPFTLALPTSPASSVGRASDS